MKITFSLDKMYTILQYMTCGVRNNHVHCKSRKFSEKNILRVCPNRNEAHTAFLNRNK
jgi:hypothetical protein